MFPVVEAGALDLTLVERKSQRLDQVKRRPNREAGAAGVAGVPVDLRLNEHHVYRHAPSLRGDSHVQPVLVRDELPFLEMPPQQAQVYHETRRGERPVGRLTPWLLDRRNLEGAFERVRDAEGADTPGVDGVTCGSLNACSGPWLTRLAEDLPDSRIEWVDDSYSFISEDRPERLAKLVGDFVRA